jgi:peptidyl-prolyl cis-trans isomerase SurA
MSTRVWPVCAAAVPVVLERVTRAERPLAPSLPLIATLIPTMIALCLFSSNAAVVFAADRPDPPIVVEEIVAKVNGDIVTRGDLARAKERMQRDMKQAGMSAAAMQQQMDKLGSDELRNEIDQLLLVQKAKELDINVDADLNREIAGIQSESKIADPDKFHEWVGQQAGIPYEEFRQQRKNALLTERVVSEEVWRNIVIPDADIQKYYDAHKADFVRKESVTLRVILISTGDNKPDTVAAAEKKANIVLTRARGSVDKFSDLARQYSDDPSATDDGLLPPFERGTLNKAVEDVVFKHDKGFVTDLIRVNAGFEILRVEDHVPEGQASLDDVRGQIANILTRPIADPKMRTFLTTLRQNAFLQVKPGYIDSGAAPGKDTSWKDPAQLMPETTTKAAVANQRHLKKLLGVIPYGMTGQKDTAPAAPPTVAPVQQAPPANNADGTPR